MTDICGMACAVRSSVVETDRRSPNVDVREWMRMEWSEQKKRVNYELLMFCNEKFFEKWDSKENCGCCSNSSSSNRNKWKRWANRWTTIKATISYRVANLRRYDRSTAQTMLVSNFFPSLTLLRPLCLTIIHTAAIHITHTDTHNRSLQVLNNTTSIQARTTQLHVVGIPAFLSVHRVLTPIEDWKKKKNYEKSINFLLFTLIWKT